MQNAFYKKEIICESQNAKKKFAKREWQTLNKHEDIKREYKNLFFKALNHHSDFGFLN